MEKDNSKTNKLIPEEERALVLEQVALNGTEEQTLKIPVDADRLRVIIKDNGPYLQYCTYPPQAYSTFFFYQCHMEEKTVPPIKEGFDAELVDTFHYNKKYFHLFIYRRLSGRKS